MKIKNTGLVGLLAAALAGWLPTLAPAATIDLTGLGFVQYGDTQSYSLPISQIQQGGCPGTGCPWKIDSTPGAIKDLIVVATGSSGTPVTTNIAGIEGAYATPSGVSGSTFFSTGTYTDPSFTGTIANASTLTWDANLLSLRTFLSGDQMVFFFNNNQTNNGAASLQSLAAWGRITITDSTGAVIGTYDFTNNAGMYALVTEGGGGAFFGDVTTYNAVPSVSPGDIGPLAGDNTATDYVLAGGQICVLTGAGPVPIPVPCSTADPDGPGPLEVSAPINHNLGADEAAYALLVPELNGQLAGLFGLDAATLSGYTLHLDLRLGCDPGTLPAGPAGADSLTCTSSPHGRSLNNGYEQVFIGTAVLDLPEPDTIALLGLGLLGILGVGVAGRRRKK